MKLITEQEDRESLQYLLEQEPVIFRNWLNCHIENFLPVDSLRIRQVIDSEILYFDLIFEFGTYYYCCTNLQEEMQCDSVLK